MLIFETVLILLAFAVALQLLARRLGIPYPTLLALGGAGLIWLPGAPQLPLPPEVLLVLFVAPVLLDAAYDSSLRDLRRNWVPVGSLALVAVCLTTTSVAIVARWLIPEMPWSAAVALGAIVAPPDAVAAVTVLRHINPPYRMRVVLEGESLLNDASALLIYKLAVAAVAAGSFAARDVAPALVTVGLGSVAAGWLLAWPVGILTRRMRDPAMAVMLEFITTFAVWLVADRLGLSGILTVVVFALTLSQHRAFRLPAQIRIPSFTVWEVVTTVLNVLAFTLIGLQLGPTLAALGPERLWPALEASAVILATVIVARLAWVLTHYAIAKLAARLLPARSHPKARVTPTFKHAVAIGWSGMRGIVTLAAAMALPVSFPNRDFIQLAAFAVVLGTLVIQGLTLGPLVRLLNFPKDDTLEREVKLAREASLNAAGERLTRDGSASAERLKAEYQAALHQVETGNTPYEMRQNRLRIGAIHAAREALEQLRESQKIGDEAYRLVEEELDWEELGATAPVKD